MARPPPRAAGAARGAAADAAADAARIAAFAARYEPPIATLGLACRERLRRRIGQGWELVYDNWNALVFGFAPTPRPSDAVLSIALYPRWVTLFFLRGAALADPARRLSGSGARVRGVRLADAADLDDPVLGELLDAALAASAVPFAAAPTMRTVIRSVSARQRPRRPA